MEQQDSKFELDVLSLLYYLKKRIMIPVASMLLFMVAGFLYSTLLIAPQYTAETRMYVLNRTDETNVVSADFTISSYLLNDYKVLITGQNVTKEVVSQLGLDMIPSQLSNKIQVIAPNNTRVLQISVTDTSPQRAADIANTVREVASRQIQEIMDVDAVHLVYAAEVPQAASGPNVSRNTLLFAGLGFIAAVAILTLIYLVDDSIRTEEDVEQYLGLCVLGVIPKSEDINTVPENTKGNKARGLVQKMIKK